MTHSALNTTNTEQSQAILGWREWVTLPELNLEHIKAKIDTGARSSALHAFAIEPYRKQNQRWVMFAIHPEQNNTELVIECHAAIKDRRMVSDSGGHKQRRYVIETQLLLGTAIISAEVTLTNRDSMLFRMLIGRTTLNDRFLIDPSASFCQGIPSTPSSL
jgi:hypothetical protein